MNATVAKIVDILFQNVEMTDDVQAVHDEVMRNCQDRFDDLRAEGKTDDEAIACVIESLKGMEDVIASYPKKARESAEPDSFSAPRESRGYADESERCRFTFENVASISYDVRDVDLMIEPTDGTTTIVEGEDCTLKARMEGDRLYIHSENRAQSGGWGRLFDLFLHTHGGEARILVPRDALIGLNLRSMSGDIEVRGVIVGDADIGSTSGDIELKPSAASHPRRVTANTASGDVKLALTAGAISARSMSGDVDLRCDCDRLDASSVSGEVSAEGRMAEAALKSVSGDVDLRCRDAAPAVITANSTSGDIRLLLPESTASVHLRANTVSGSIRSAFTDAGPDSQVRATVSTVSGDVEVKRA